MIAQFLGFISLVTLAVILCFFKTEENTNCWYSGFVMSISLGLLAFLIDPTPLHHANLTIVPNQLLARFLSSLSYRFSPYFLLLAALSLGSSISNGSRRVIYLFATLPICAGYIYDFFFPMDGFIHVYLDYSNQFPFLAVWGSVYVLIANVLVVFSVFTVSSELFRRQRALLAIMTLPSIYITYMAYIVPQYKSHDFTIFTGSFGVFFLIMFVFFALRFGIMGFKINIEKRQLDYNFKNVASGTAMLNHVIKNEIAKLGMAVTVIQDSQVYKPEIIEIMSNSIDYLSAILTRIHTKTNDIEIIATKTDVISAVSEAVNSMSELIEKNHIDLTIRNEMDNQKINYDKTHIIEVLKNVIQNAIEGLQLSIERKIIITLKQTQRNCELWIKDTGCGISKESLSRVFEPFFSTKKMGLNFGLGLSYCYLVMKKHNGSIKIESEVNKGTTVILRLPRVEC